MTTDWGPEAAFLSSLEGRYVNELFVYADENISMFSATGG